MSSKSNGAAALLRSLRPHQWVKNVLLFGGLAFTGRWHQATSGAGAGAVLDWSAIGHACLAFAVFCMLSSAGYLVNDIRDREADRLHPQKKHRPIASGAVSVRLAAVLAVVLFAVALGLAWLLSYRAGAAPETHLFVLTALAYLVLTNWYSFALKQYVLVDVLTVAILFVLRAVAGCFVIPEPPSPWIIVCTLFGALMMALCKRRAELVALVGETGTSTRDVLSKYQSTEGNGVVLVDQLIQTAATATILTYAMYTFSRPREIGMVGEQMGLMATIPFVVYGVFRYLYLVHKRDIGQNPEQLFRDVPMLLDLAVWAAVVLFVTRGRSF